MALPEGSVLAKTSLCLSCALRQRGKNIMAVSPLQSIAHAFEADFIINFLIENLEGSVTLILTDKNGSKIRRIITAEQLADPAKVQRVIDTIRFGMAIDAGQGISVMKALSEPANDQVVAPLLGRHDEASDGTA
jgi:hypothetical protein